MTPRFYGRFAAAFVLNAALFWGTYFIGSTLLAGLSDPDGYYLTLTAFAYTAEITGLCLVMLTMTALMARATIGVTPWRKVLSDLTFIYSASIFVLCAAVFANKMDWWYRLIFADDKYGYYTTRPGTAALIGTCALLAVVATALGWSVSRRVGRLAGWAATIVTLAVAVGAGIYKYSVLVAG